MEEMLDTLSCTTPSPVELPSYLIDSFPAMPPRHDSPTADQLTTEPVVAPEPVVQPEPPGDRLTSLVVSVSLRSSESKAMSAVVPITRNFAHPIIAVQQRRSSLLSSTTTHTTIHKTFTSDPNETLGPPQQSPPQEDTRPPHVGRPQVQFPPPLPPYQPIMPRTASQRPQAKTHTPPLGGNHRSRHGSETTAGGDNSSNVSDNDGVVTDQATALPCLPLMERTICNASNCQSSLNGTKPLAHHANGVQLPKFLNVETVEVPAHVPGSQHSAVFPNTATHVPVAAGTPSQETNESKHTHVSPGGNHGGLPPSWLRRINTALSNACRSNHPTSAPRAAQRSQTTPPVRVPRNGSATNTALRRDHPPPKPQTFEEASRMAMSGSTPVTGIRPRRC